MSAEAGVRETHNFGREIRNFQIDLPRGASLEVRAVADGLEAVDGVRVPKLTWEGEEEEFAWSVIGDKLHLRQNDGQCYALPGGMIIGSERKFVLGISPNIRPKATLWTPQHEDGGRIDVLDVMGGSRVTLDSLSGNHVSVQRAGSIALSGLYMRSVFAETGEAGGIVLDDVAAEVLTARTTRGNIVVTGGGTTLTDPEEEGGWRLTSMLGNIRYLELPRGVVKAWGNVHLNLPQPEA